MNPIAKNNGSFFSDSTIRFLVLLLSIYSVQAQSSPPSNDYPYARFSPSMAIIIVVLVAALFFMGFFSIYIRRCSNDGGASVRAALSMRRAGRLAAASRGLDSQVLETFPTFAYSTVKGLKIGKGALECAVCLNEFEDEETIRLIPKCDHVFHAECIDAWLENHVTCPVCRCDLVPKPGESTQTGLESLSGEINSQLPTAVEGGGNPDVLIRVSEGNEITDPTPSVLNGSKSVRGLGFFEKFRSHSTGHSLVLPGENTDRFTLRLPEAVRKQVITTALLNRSGSSVRMGREGSARKGYRTGEGSSRGRSYRRMGSLDRVLMRSDRWVFGRAPSFLSRAFSIRRQKVVADDSGASTSKTTADNVPLNNIGPKSDAPGSKDADLGRPPV